MENKIGNYYVYTVRELAEVFKTSRQAVDQKIHGKKAQRDRIIKMCGMEIPFIRIGMEFTIFYTQNNLENLTCSPSL